MSNYDDYFTNDDKPFAENLNDALLLSNVFNMTVPIELPTMFSNSTWINNVSPRKAGVAIITLKEQLPSGVNVSSIDNKSILTGTGIVKLGFYPNFNSFGQIKSIDWENTGTISINLKTTDGTTIASDISKGIIENQSSDLRTLQEIVIEIVFTNATLKSLTVTMEHKSQNRYGAEISISNVSGLSETLDSYDNDISTINENITNIDNTEWVSLYQTADNPYCEAYVYLRKYNGFLEIQGVFNRQGSGLHTLTVEIPEDLRFTPKAKENHRYYTFPLITNKNFIGDFNGQRLYFSYDTSVYGTLVSHYFYGLYPID